MKTIARITSILVYLILLTSCAQSIDGNLEDDYINREGNITYYKGAPYTGEIVTIWTYTGELRSKINYKDGRYDGLYETYHKNGQLDVKTNYNDGEYDGLYEEWLDDGRLLRKEHYKDGINDGLYEMYQGEKLCIRILYEDGQEINREHFCQGE